MTQFLKNTLMLAGVFAFAASNLSAEGCAKPAVESEKKVVDSEQTAETATETPAETPAAEA